VSEGEERVGGYGCEMKLTLSFCSSPFALFSFVLIQMLISILYSAVIIGLGTSQLIDMQAAKAEADFKKKEAEQQASGREALDV
jgi:hypothetical protein